MTTYFLLYSLLLVICLLKSKDRIIGFIVCFVLSLLGFLRSSNVGTDCIAYSNTFNNMNLWYPQTWNYDAPFDEGFNIFCGIFKLFISDDPMTLWGLIPMIYVVGCYSFFKRYSPHPNIALLLFYLFGSYFLSYNIMRQCFAVGIMMFAFSKIDIEQRNLKKSLILLLLMIIIGYYFHNTVYILVFVPLVSWLTLKYEIPKAVLYVMLVVSLILFFSNYMVYTIMNVVNYFGIEGKLVNYAIHNAQMEEDSGYSKIKVVLLALYGIYYLYEQKGRITSFVLLYIISLCFLFVFGVLVVEFARVFEILYLFSIIAITQSWNNVRHEKLFHIATLVYASVLFVNILLKGYGGIIPYEFRYF